MKEQTEGDGSLLPNDLGLLEGTFDRYTDIPEEQAAEAIVQGLLSCPPAVESHPYSQTHVDASDLNGTGSRHV